MNPQATMQVEFHQLERRWGHLRVRQAQRQRRLMASLAESGQQTPIVVVLSAGERERLSPTENCIQRLSALCNIVTFRSPWLAASVSNVFNAADFKGIRCG